MRRKPTGLEKTKKGMLENKMWPASGQKSCTRETKLCPDKRDDKVKMVCVHENG